MANVRHLLIGLASSTALYSGLVPALGLGDIALHSALSQPLDAEIELLDAADLSSADLHVRLAPAAVFQNAGVERLYALNDLRFTPLLRGTKSVIRVVSSQPIREPYLNFIVEVERPNGKLYREYTLLLDPPGSVAYRSLATPAPVAAAPPPSSPAPAPAPAPAVAMQATAAPRQTSAPKAVPQATQGKTYTVASGDSLWKIADRVNPGQQSQRALMEQIQALNPNAFAGGDSHRLKAGAQLLLPDTAAVSAPTALAAIEPQTVSEPQANVAEPAAVADKPRPAAPAEAVLSIDPEELPAKPEPATPEQQAKLEQQLDSQLAETIQLQQSLAELGAQVQDLREQMGNRDKQIVALLAQLAAKQEQAPPATASNEPVVGTQQLPETAGVRLDWLSAIGVSIAALLALLAAWRWRSLRSAKKQQPPVSPTAPAQPVAAVPVRRTNLAPSVIPVMPEAAQVPTLDPLQSANVFIAHGQLNEAVRTLRQGLAEHPQRGDLGYRLLEVLALQGDSAGFTALEGVVRSTGFSPVRIDQLKAQYGQLFSVASAGVLDDVVLNLEPEPSIARDSSVQAEAPLNLDSLELDAEWDVLSPFADEAKAQAEAEPALDGADIATLIGHRDARSPFAQSMLVEEAHNETWAGESLELDLPDIAPVEPPPHSKRT